VLDHFIGFACRSKTLSGGGHLRFAALLNGLASHWRADLPGTHQNWHEGGQNLFSFIF